jgi:hypothetical protein
MSPRRRTNAATTEGQGENAAELQRLLDLESQEQLDRAIEEMNSRHFVVMDRGKTVVFTARHDVQFNRVVLDRSQFTDITQWYGGRMLSVKGPRGTLTTKSLGDVWLHHPRRRDYDQIIFDPGAEESPGIYNLWRGFRVQPKQGSWSGLRDHLHEVIASGNDRVTRYFIGWMARAVQRPGHPGEVGLVMRGGQGTGKGTLVKCFGHLFGQHFVHVSRTQHLTGNFNAHLQDAVLVFADEAVWGGDRQNEGALKALITEPTLPIEKKGVDTYIVKNVIHLMVASNNDWCVPTGMDDRRFCVVDVLPHRAGDHAYFKKIFTQMEHEGGYAAMLFDLQAFDLMTFDHRKPPQTAALLDQKIRAFSPVQRWWFHKLNAGQLLPSHSVWEPQVSREELYADYVRTLNDAGEHRKKFSTELGIALTKMLPPLWPQSHRVSIKGTQVWIYRLPGLSDCREAFAKALKQEVEWPEVAEHVSGDLPSEEAA